MSQLVNAATVSNIASSIVQPIITDGFLSVKFTITNSLNCYIIQITTNSIEKKFIDINILVLLYKTQ